MFFNAIKSVTNRHCRLKFLSISSATRPFRFRNMRILFDFSVVKYWNLPLCQPFNGNENLYRTYGIYVAAVVFIKVRRNIVSIKIVWLPLNSRPMWTANWNSLQFESLLLWNHFLLDLHWLLKCHINPPPDVEILN